jgi:hypothetical protein
MTYFFMGGFVTFFIGVIIGGFIFFLYIMDQQVNNRLIRITNWTAGTPYVEWFRGKKMRHKELGEVYYIKKLTKEKRQFIPYFGTDKEFPTNKSRQMYVPITYWNGVYVPEKYDPHNEQEIEVIEEVKNLDKDGKEITIFKRVKKKLPIFISKTIPQSNRQFYLKSDVEIEREFAQDQGWWAKYGHTIALAGMYMVSGIVCVIMIIFAYETVGDILAQSTPAWLQTLVDTLQGGQAPPPTP